ncbi:MAG: hypothetical protein V8S26_02515 [Lachnospiraceae bacterium]
MKQWWEQIRSFGKQRKKEQLLTAVLVVVILLLVFWPSAADHEKQEKQQTEKVQTQVQAEETNADERKKLEDDLKRILLQVEGVGEVDVAVTMESTGHKLVEKDVPLSESSVDETGNGTNSKKESKNSEEATVYLENADGTKAPYVIEETMPVVRGVLVVAQGADDPQVVAEIKEAAMALFHLEAHKIKVMKKK